MMVFVGMFEVALLSMFFGRSFDHYAKEGGLDWLIQRIYSLTRLFKVGRERAGEIGLSFWWFSPTFLWPTTL